MKTIHLVLLLLISVGIAAKSDELHKYTFVEVSPSALDVMIHAFDQVLVYFHNYNDRQQLDAFLKRYQPEIMEIRMLYPNDHSLFGYVNLTNDYKGDLDKFGKSCGFKLMTTFQINDLLENDNLFDFYSAKIHPKMKLMYRNEFERLNKESNGHHLVFPYSNVEALDHYNGIYAKIKNFIGDYVEGIYAMPTPNATRYTASLHRLGKQIFTFDLFNLTEKEAADQIIQQTNIATLQTVVGLSEDNFHRVFGGSIQTQMLFIYKESEAASSQVRKAYEAYEQAASTNRFQGLAFERALFTTVNDQIFSEYFNQDLDELLNSTSRHYLIYLTMTDYDRFQLKRYRFQPLSDSFNSTELLQFIEDARQKKLDPEYKSEPIPSWQEQSQRILRKIVGKSFISQVYEKPDQSILILFIDSKDESSYSKIQNLLEEFTKVHRAEIEENLITAIFDLDKNEHKLLYLKEAPQLVLFDKANKKQTKYIKIGENATLDDLTMEIKRAVTNVYWNTLSDL